MHSPDEQFEVTGQVHEKYPLYYATAEANLSGIYPLPKAQLVLDLKKPYFKLYAVGGGGKGSIHHSYQSLTRLRCRLTRQACTRACYVHKVHIWVE
jgi:hypothetical protein